MNATTTAPTMPAVCPACSDWGFVSPPARVAAVAALRAHLATGAPVAAYAGPWADDYPVVPCDCAKGGA